MSPTDPHEETLPPTPASLVVPAPDTPTLPQADAPTLGNVSAGASLPGSEKPGDTIGRYTLVSVLGEGGMGTVFLAEQHEPVKRRVALKVIKLGMDTRQVVARFEAERQALAMMDHPGIAKVFDAGATQSGRPFFVMELVDGVPLTKYCDEQRLNLPARLKLFIHVCQALQHAHQKGIIHRDLKPSNILVTQQDGAAVPKVIDFGVAKATGRQLSDATLTEVNAFLGTPSYASPEQAGAVPDVDTRSDVYTLGVILYELLTGKLPLDPETLKRAAVDEVLRRIREEDPPKPSTRIAALGSADQTTIADRRRTETRRLANALRGDLNWVVMKALEKDRSRRYESASGLAADLERHLNNEPVSAAAPSTFYLLSKFARRNKVPLAAATAVAVALIVGTVVSLQQAAVAREAEAKSRKAASDAKRSEAGALKSEAEAQAEKKRAADEAAVAKAVNAFLHDDLLRQASSFAQASAGFDPQPNLTVREALDRSAERIGQRFTNQPLVEAAIRSAIGDAYRGVGEATKAIEHLEKSHALRRAKLGPDHPDTLTTMAHLAVAYIDGLKLDLALPLLEEALKLHKAKLGPEHPGTLATMNNLALAYRDAGKLDLALPLYEETLKLNRAQLGSDHPNTLLTMNNLGAAYRDVGKLDQALPLYEETLKLQKAKLGPEHPDTLRSMNNLASAYRAARKFDLSLPLFEEALKQTKAKLGPDHPGTLITMHNLAVAYQAAGKLDQALTLYAETLKLRKAKLGPDHPGTLMTMNHFADAYQAAGKPDQALTLYAERLKLQKARLGPEHPDTLKTAANLGANYSTAKRYAEAEALLVESQIGLKRPEVQSSADGRLWLRYSLQQLVRLYTDWGKPDKAAEWKQKLAEFDKTAAAQKPAAKQP